MNHVYHSFRSHQSLCFRWLNNHWLFVFLLSLLTSIYTRFWTAALDAWNSIIFEEVGWMFLCCFFFLAVVQFCNCVGRIDDIVYCRINSNNVVVRSGGIVVGSCDRSCVEFSSAAALSIISVIGRRVDSSRSSCCCIIIDGSSSKFTRWLIRSRDKEIDPCSSVDRRLLLMCSTVDRRLLLFLLLFILLFSCCAAFYCLFFWADVWLRFAL